MASAKLQKPANSEGTCTNGHEEHKFTNKISDMPAWGSRVFGGNNQKQEEHQAAVTKKQHHSGWFGQKKTATTTSSLTQHCSTCQCPRSDKDVPTKDMKPTASTNTEMKGKKEERIIAVNKDGKTHASTEAKKNEKIKDVKHNASAEKKKKKKKDKKEHGAGTKVEPCNAIMKKENKEEHVNHCFPKTAEHWKDKVTVKNKDGKHNDGSSSSSDSDSDSEDEASKKRKLLLKREKALTRKKNHIQIRNKDPAELQGIKNV